MKRRAYAFRNRERLRHAIYFHCAERDLYSAAYTDSRSDSVGGLGIACSILLGL